MRENLRIKNDMTPERVNEVKTSIIWAVPKV